MNKKLLRKKLAMMLAGLKKTRKYYCEVEYLEGTGTQYIDTGLDYFADFEVGIQLRTNVSNKALGNGIFYCMQRYNASNPYWQFTNEYSSYSYNTTTPITEHHIMKWKENKIYSDGVLLTDFTKDSNAPNRMYLYSADGTNRYPNMIYFCKLWNPDNGELVRDFIPVLDWDMTPCMYDKVTGQLFYNQGQGSFSYGREIHPVEYLESTGTQYIDTGVNPKANTTSVDFEFSLNQLYTSGVGIFGSRATTDPKVGKAYNLFSGTVEGTDRIRNDWSYECSVCPYTNNNYPLTNPITANTKIRVQLNADGSSKIDNDIFSNPRLTKTNCEYPMYLGCVNTAGTAFATKLSAKWYHCNILENNILVREFVPAVDQNGVGFMFDTVSHTIFDNAGTETFKYPAREVEYLTSNGNQYIDSGVECTGDLVVQFKGSCSTNVNAASCGGLIATPRFRHHWSPFITNFSYWMQADMLNSASIKPFVFSLDTVFEALIDPVNGVATINGVIYRFTPVSSDETTGNNYGIFARIANDGTIQSRPCSFYYFKMSRNNTLVRDFIPCYKDGVACMVDKLTGTAYLNQGTGTFSVGRILEPEYE